MFVLLNGTVLRLQFPVIPSSILLSDIIFSTAHKAKGLEFDSVRVTDDYLPGTDLGMSIREYIL